MNELLAAATRMCNAVAAYYEKAAGASPAAALGPAPEAKPEAKPRVKKDKEKAPEAAAPQPAAPAVLDEKGSEERLKVVGEAFVQRFSKSGDAVDEVKKTIESKFKVSRLRDLVHAQRVELIATLEARIKEIDSKATQSAAPAATGLGL